jgi:hypothetical protein
MLRVPSFAGLFILVMDEGLDEASVGGGVDEARDVIGSNSGTTTLIRRQLQFH